MTGIHDFLFQNSFYSSFPFSFPITLCTLVSWKGEDISSTVSLMALSFAAVHILVVLSVFLCRGLLGKQVEGGLNP